MIKRVKRECLHCFEQFTPKTVTSVYCTEQYSKLFESVCMCLPIIIISVLLGAQVRINIINKGGDDFTANIFFLTVICVGLVIYAGITLFLHTLYDVAIRIFVNRKKPVLVNEFISVGSIKNIGKDLKAKEEIRFNNRLDVALKYTQE